MHYLYLISSNDHITLAYANASEFECPASHCLNGGTCETLTTTACTSATSSTPCFRCICPIGFHGDTCQNVTLACDKVACQNGGTCLEVTPSTFVCQCLPMYNGTYCSNLGKSNHFCKYHLLIIIYY